MYKDNDIAYYITYLDDFFVVHNAILICKDLMLLEELLRDTDYYDVLDIEEDTFLNVMLAASTMRCIEYIQDIQLYETGGDYTFKKIYFRS